MKDDEKVALAGCVMCVLLLPFLVAGCYCASKVQLSDGYRDGTVRKLSTTGVFFRTVEVEVLGDGLRGVAGKHGASLQPETFQYTVRDPGVAAALAQVPPGRRVRLHYTKHLTAWQPGGETRFFVTAVEVLP